jgi:hypothetical protein
MVQHFVSSPQALCAVSLWTFVRFPFLEQDLRHSSLEIGKTTFLEFRLLCQHCHPPSVRMPCHGDALSMRELAA